MDLTVNPIIAAAVILGLILIVRRVLQDRREARMANEIIRHRMRQALNPGPPRACVRCGQMFEQPDAEFALLAHFRIHHLPVPVDVIDRQH